MATFQTQLPLDEQADALNGLTLAYTIEALLERSLRNLGFINSSSQVQPLPFVNANLYQLAVQYYQDWTMWELIRDANNLDDYLVPGIAYLIIPPNPNQVIA